ncbi:MAG: prepilin-type N-terminal cleavage/methylation domain-containing protein [Candidatus Omnitrophica bacterium]|nr:prepilin-type N-terminal cleavage/methylation domain-containing protein [Candidatus Omnitrophota bacterium]
MKKSFTLVELLIVIVIIAVMASFALPKFEEALWKARDMEVRQLLETIFNDIVRYYGIYGAFPGINEVRKGDKLVGPTVAVPTMTKDYMLSYFGNGSFRGFLMKNGQIARFEQIKPGQALSYWIEYNPAPSVMIMDVETFGEKIQCGNFPPIYKYRRCDMKLKDGTPVELNRWP